MSSYELGYKLAAYPGQSGKISEIPYGLTPLATPTTLNVAGTPPGASGFSLAPNSASTKKISTSQKSFSPFSAIKDLSRKS